VAEAAAAGVEVGAVERWRSSSDHAHLCKMILAQVFSLGKIGDSYSLEVRVIAHVHTVLYNFFWVSPLFCLLFISHPDVTAF
jgi:hypothetical protein